MRLKTSSTAIANLLTGIGTGLAIMFPNSPWIGGAIILCSVGIFLFDVRIENGHVQAGSYATVGYRIKRAWLQLCGFAFLGAAVALAIGELYLWRSNDIFAQIGNRYEMELGKPIDNGQLEPTKTGGGVQEAWFGDSSYVIWLSDFGSMIGFDDDGRHCAFTKDISVADPSMYDAGSIRSSLGLTKDELVPTGALAYELIHDRKDWGWLKELERQSVIDEKKVFVQRYEHGQIIGPLRRNYKNGDNNSALFLIYLDKGKCIVEGAGPIAPSILRDIKPAE